MLRDVYLYVLQHWVPDCPPRPPRATRTKGRELMKKTTRQLDTLYDQIVGNVSPTGTDNIFIYPIEAGMGKTITLVDALWALHEEKPWVKSLVVVPQKCDADNLERELKGIGIAVHGDRGAEDEIVENAKDVIITHSMFRNVCKIENWNEQNYKRFIKGRHNLVIDEEFHPFDFASVNHKGYHMLRNSIGEIDLSVLALFDKVFSNIGSLLVKTEVAGNSGTHIFRPKPLNTSEKIALRKIEEKIFTKYNNYRFFAKLKTIHSEADNEKYAWPYKELNELFVALREIRTSSFCVCDRSGIHCIQNGYEFCLLENNIMLDASASILEIGPQKSVRHVVPMDRITDHSDWTLKVYNTKSTKNAKLFDFGIYDDVAELIEVKCSNKDNHVLIIGSADDVGSKDKPKGKLQCLKKECCQKYKEQLSFANFSAMRGKNRWAQYNHIIIMHTPYRPTWHYPLVFNYYNPNYKLSDYDLQHSYSNKKGFEHPCFRNKDLDIFRETDMAATAYQAIKRINRDNVEKAEVHLITADQNIIRILEDHLLGIQIEEHELRSKKRHKEEKRPYNRKEESQVRVALKKLFVDMANGKYRAHERPANSGCYPKKWCMSMIGCNGHFSRYMNSIANHMNGLGIHSNQHNVIVSKYCED